MHAFTMESRTWGSAIYLMALCNVYSSTGGETITHSNVDAFLHSRRGNQSASGIKASEEERSQNSFHRNITISDETYFYEQDPDIQFHTLQKDLSKYCSQLTEGELSCAQYNNTNCYQYMVERNENGSRTCIKSIPREDEVLVDFFGNIKYPYKEDEDCTEIEKWLVCSFLYPKCDVEISEVELPCREVCEWHFSNVCRRGAVLRFERLQMDIFKRKVIPSCEHLPSMKQRSCDRPQFIVDILDKHRIPEEEHKRSLQMIVFVCVGILAAIVAGFIIMRISRHYRKPKRKFHRRLSLKEIHTIHREATSSGNRGSFDIACEAFEDMDTLIKTKNITLFARSNLKVEETLGEGEFGKVVKCQTKDINNPSKMNLVAVKYLKVDASDVMEQSFQREVEILSHFQHPNVIPLLGVCIDSRGPKCIILEFMKYGDLNQYIRDRSGSYYALSGCHGKLPDDVEYRSPLISFHKLLFITQQIADGVDYLSKRRFVHRDLATRNILVGDDMHVKISDFGLARDIYCSDYYRVDSKKVLPLRWLSPEALTLGKFTTHSDMWAFGVVMWELFSYGMSPFGGHSNEEICERIRCHKILEKPYGCPSKIYDLMKACWKFEPTNRKPCSCTRDTIAKWLRDDEHFIKIAWKQLLLRPTLSLKSCTLAVGRAKSRRYFSTTSRKEVAI